MKEDQNIEWKQEGVQRLETFLFPYAAVREALLNAVVHKDYSYGVPIQISVYDDHLVLWNYGHMPDDWTMERFLGKHSSEPFNPLLANAFFRAGYIESWGRGIEKITRECEAHGIAAPKYEFDRSGLMMTFQANPEHWQKAIGGENVGETTQKTTRKTTQKIVVILKQNPFSSRQEIAKTLGDITENGVKYHLDKLKSAGIIQRIGADKGGHWEVIGDAHE